MEHRTFNRTGFKEERRMEPLPLRPDEAARTLGVSRAMVYALLSAGVLPSVRVGSLMRVPVDALRQWIERQAAPTK
jgi:excisionase family DNA binding protein